MTTAVDAVKWLETNAQDPAFREIAKTIKDLITDDIEFVLKPGKRNAGMFRYTLDSKAKPVNKKLIITKKGMNESTSCP